eukprot:8588410-Pyramimonas_sp.AAC.2
MCTKSSVRKRMRGRARRGLLQKTAVEKAILDTTLARDISGLSIARDLSGSPGQSRWNVGDKDHDDSVQHGHPTLGDSSLFRGDPTTNSLLRSPEGVGPFASRCRSWPREHAYLQYHLRVTSKLPPGSRGAIITQWRRVKIPAVKARGSVGRSDFVPQRPLKSILYVCWPYELVGECNPPMKIASPHELVNCSMTFTVYDRKRYIKKKLMIGTVSFDLESAYFQKNHELHRVWFTLTEGKGRRCEFAL